MAKNLKNIKSEDEKAQAAFRKLLLAKQLYFHGLEHSNNLGMLDKMIAVHHFHNAVEIVLKAIILHFDIRPENQLNIDFGIMINEINKHKTFKEKNMVLPYQREIKILNQHRNFVQHHGIEPPLSAVDDFRAITKHFLIDVYQDYFDKSFDDLSAVDMIDDNILRELLRISLASITESKFKKSVILSTIAFKLSSSTISNFLPAQNVLSTFFRIPYECKIEHLEDILKRLDEKANDTLYLIALLSSGVKLVDYKQFQSIAPIVNFFENGSSNVHLRTSLPDENKARWLHNFVVSIIIHWQTIGLKLVVSEKCKIAMEEIIKERGIRYD
jgi:hypothetical protein